MNQRIMTMIAKWMAFSAFALFLNAGECGAQSAPPAKRSWASLTMGFGPAIASMHGDTIYEGSGQVFAHLGFVRQLSPMRALELTILGIRPFGAGDCIPGFTVCAPPFNVVGVSGNLLTTVGGPVAPDRFLAGFGAGVFRVAPNESHAVSPRPAVGLQASVEAPLVVGSHAALAIGIRGLLLPMVHGQSLGVALLSASLRTW